MQASWQKWVPLSGILFVILFIIGGAIIGGGDFETNNDQEVLDWYNDSGHQTLAVIGVYLWAVAAVAFLLFINRLRAVVAAAEGQGAVFAPFIFAGGIVWTACLCIGATAIGGISAEIKFGDVSQLSDPDIARFMPTIGYGAILVVGMIPLIFAMFTTAYASMRYKLFAGWFNWLTIICGVILFFAAAFFPGIALLVWVIAASLQLMKHQPGATAAA